VRQVRGDLHGGLKVGFEPGNTKQLRQAVCPALVGKALVRKLLRLHQLGNAGLQRAFHSVPGQVVRGRPSPGRQDEMLRRLARRSLEIVGRWPALIPFPLACRPQRGRRCRVGVMSFPSLPDVLWYTGPFLLTGPVALLFSAGLWFLYLRRVFGLV